MLTPAMLICLFGVVTEDTGAPEVPVATPQAEIVQRLDEVLARPEFRPAEPFVWSIWLEDLGRWLVDLFSGLSETIRQLPPVLFWLVVLWLVLALVAILGHLLWVLLGTVGWAHPSRSSRLGRDGEGIGIFGVQALDYESIIARARDLLAAGDWQQAVRHFYVASILWLDEAGKVHFHPAKTNRDYLREIESPAAARQAFATLTREFEAAVYGSQPADRSRCVAMQQQLQELQAQYVH